MRANAGSQGFVMVSVAILLIVLLGFAALAIDVGMFYTSRTAAQRAADTAALAGAFTFVASPSAPQPATARSHALDVALNSKIMGHSILAANVNVTVVNRQVTVDIAHVEGSFFAKVLGISSANIAVRAIAEAFPNAVGSACAKPWFIPNTLLSSNALCGTGNACASNEVMILPDGTVNQTFVNQYVGVQRTIKPGNPQNALTPGQFYAVRLGDSAGGNDYRTNIASCPGELVTCQKTYGVEPGNMIGPTNQGVLELIGSPPDRWDDTNPAPPPPEGYEYQFIRPDNTTTTTSNSLVVAPIWDVCSMGAYCDAMDRFQLPDGGATIQIPVVGFALLFLDGVSGNDVLAHLLGVFPCGSTPITNDEVTGPYSVPVRLIRTS
ncbi:MAG: pilus assembly protein TadG-related protein [Acidobacteriota bacterium]